MWLQGGTGDDDERPPLPAPYASSAQAVVSQSTADTKSVYASSTVGFRAAGERHYTGRFNCPGNAGRPYEGSAEIGRVLYCAACAAMPFCS